MDGPLDGFFKVEVMTGYGVAQARNRLVSRALSGGFTHVLFVDSDQVLPSDTLTKLLSCEASVVGGWSMMALGDSRTNISKYDSEKKCYDFFTVDEVPKGIVDVDGIGFSAVLVGVDVFSRISYPYFTYVEYPNGTVLSEDLYFCNQLRGSGILVKCDTSLRVPHIKQVYI
jgi:hypothetical protein